MNAANPTATILACEAAMRAAGGRPRVRAIADVLDLPLEEVRRVVYRERNRLRAKTGHARRYRPATRRWCDAGGHVVPAHGFGAPSSCRCGTCEDCRWAATCLGCKALDDPLDPRARWHDPTQIVVAAGPIFSNVILPGDARFVRPVFEVRCG